MTVATKKSKTDPLVMGANAYDFNFKCLLRDPTEADAREAIKVVISDGTNETSLVYGEDYSVELNTSGTGGMVTVKDPKDSSWTLVVYREYKINQGSDYRDYNAFPAETVEGDLDKDIMIAQQLQEQVDRCVQVGMTSKADPKTIVGYIERVNNSIDNIDKVADSISDVNNLSDNIDAIKSVNDNEQSINNVATNISAIKNASDNMSAILDAPAQATAAANSASSAATSAQEALASQTAANTSAANAASSATAAANSQTDAANSKTAAKQSELKAAAYAERVRSEGIPMSIIEQRRIKKDGSTVKLYWRDPRDTIIDGYTLASWKSTTIVKKQGSYPEDVDDGTVVATVTTRNQYLDSPLTDTQENPANWYYRAFPLSVNGVYCLDKRNCFGVVLYGYRINKVDPVPSTKVEYLQYCDNYFYDPCKMDFATDKFGWGSWRKAFMIPKPAALLYSGAVSYYLDPDDFTKKADGTVSDVSNSAFGGNFMAEFPDIFVKFWDEDNYFYCLFSNIKLDDGFECWATKKADGTYTGRFYMPMFEGTNIDGKLRSIATAGKPTASTNAETEATLAHANGANWETTTWAQELIMMLLFPLLFKTTDSQTALGYGGSGSTSGLTVSNDSAVTRGMMYGTSGGSSYGVTYLGMHNWWGHRWRRPNGLMNMNGNYAFKMTPSTVDGSTVTGFNRTGNGYVKSGVVPPAASGSYIDRYQAIGNKGFVPQTTTGSSTTHFCDGVWTNNGQLDQLILGGSVSNGAIDGVFCFSVYDLPSASTWSYGASVSYTPF